MTDERKKPKPPPPATPFEAQLTTLLKIVLKYRSAPSAKDEGDLTCALCADDNYWWERYGPGWEAWQWWYCGPLGLNCPKKAND
jgi:hypothetical protein